MDTLMVRRLPDCLSESDLNLLFVRFGAQGVRREKRWPKGRSPIVFVKFASETDATYAMHRLHQLRVLNRRLSVEFADFTFLPEPRQTEQPSGKKQEKAHGRSARPAYPPADADTVARISRLLLVDAEFYRRVLDLMRSMNLPPPFDPSAKSKPVEVLEPAGEIDEVEMEELYKEDTDESELELDPEQLQHRELVPQLPVKKRKALPLATRSRKILRQTELKPAKETAKVEEAVESLVFDRVRFPAAAKLLVRIPGALPGPPAEAPADEAAPGFGTFAPPTCSGDAPADEDAETVDNESPEFVTKSKLEANRITPKEMKLLPVFKNYASGQPNSRLYVKNLAKTVKEDDLKHIYGRYVVWTSQEERNMFDIRLMTEGRMKGQAFVTLPSVSRAQQALHDTNGFVLHFKPLVVHFARSAQVQPKPP